MREDSRVANEYAQREEQRYLLASEGARERGREGNSISSTCGDPRIEIQKLNPARAREAARQHVVVGGDKIDEEIYRPAGFAAGKNRNV